MQRTENTVKILGYELQGFNIELWRVDLGYQVRQGKDLFFTSPDYIEAREYFDHYIKLNSNEFKNLINRVRFLD